MKKSRVLLHGLFLLAAPCFVNGALADGTLESFEREIAAPNRNDAAPESGTGRHSGQGRLDVLLNLLFGVYVDSGSSGFFDEPGVPNVPGATRGRKPGDPQLSTVRLDAGYQNLRSDVSAVDGGVEIGVGRYALHHRSTHLSEMQPADILRMDQTHFLVRAATQPGVEADFGIGYISIEGNQHSSGLSLSVPIRWKVNSWSAVEMRAAWAEVNGHGISDYDLALGFLRRFAGVRLGYRYIDARNVPALQGPFAGVSFYY